MKKLYSYTFLLFFALNSFADGSQYCSTATNISSSGTYIANNLYGDQWYKYTNTSSSAKELTASSCGLTTSDTYVQFRASCSSTSSLAFSNDYCSNQSQAKYEVPAGGFVYICWRRYYTTYTYLWTLTIKDLSNTTCAGAVEVTEGTYTANNSIGDQWYKYTNNTSKPKTVTASSCGTTTADTYVQFRAGCNSTSSLAFSNDYCSNQSQAEYEVPAGSFVYIRWLSYNTLSSYSWKLTIDDQTNTTCAAAIELIEEGTYQADNSKGEQWYRYTNNTNNNQELNFSTCGLTSAKTYVKLYKSCSSNYVDYDYSSCNSQSDLSYEIEPNETIYINWEDYYTTSTYSWEFDIIGNNSCNDATSVTLGDYTTSNLDGVKMYSYTNSTGNSQDITISSCGKTNINTYLNVYSTCSGAKQVAASNDDHCGSQSQVTLTVAPNKTIYFEWLDIYFRGTIDWVITTDVLVNNVNTISSDNSTITTFPNPVSKTFNINSQHNIKKVQIFTTQGQIIKDVEINDFETSINLSSLPSGIYLVKIHTKNGITTDTFIKK